MINGGSTDVSDSAATPWGALRTPWAFFMAAAESSGMATMKQGREKHKHPSKHLSEAVHSKTLQELLSGAMWGLTTCAVKRKCTKTIFLQDCDNRTAT